MKGGQEKKAMLTRTQDIVLGTNSQKSFVTHIRYWNYSSCLTSYLSMVVPTRMRDEERWSGAAWQREEADRQVSRRAGPGKLGVFSYERLPQTLNTEVEVEYVRRYSHANVVRGVEVPI